MASSHSLHEAMRSGKQQQSTMNRPEVPTTSVRENKRVQEGTQHEPMIVFPKGYRVAENESSNQAHQSCLRQFGGNSPLIRSTKGSFISQPSFEDIIGSSIECDPRPVKTGKLRMEEASQKASTSQPGNSDKFGSSTSCDAFRTDPQGSRLVGEDYGEELENFGRKDNAEDKRDEQLGGYLKEGDVVQFFSRSAEDWVDGEVVEILDGDLIRVDCQVGQYWIAKTLHMRSDHVMIPPSATKLPPEESDPMFCPTPLSTLEQSIDDSLGGTCSTRFNVWRSSSRDSDEEARSYKSYDSLREPSPCQPSPCHSINAEAAFQQGRLYHEQSKNEEALREFNKALHFYNATSGKYLHRVADVRRELAAVYNDQSRYEEALHECRRALLIEKDLDKTLKRATTLCIMGSVYEKQSKFDEAFNEYEKACCLLVLKRNCDHYSRLDMLAQTRNHMGVVYRKKCMYEAALQEFGHALDYWLERTPTHHKTIADIRNNIGSVYWKQSKHTEALQEYREALKIRNFFCGVDHPLVASLLRNIGMVYEQQSRYEEALQEFQQALKIYSQENDNLESGERKANMAKVLSNMGMVYWKQSNYEKAMVKYRTAVEVQLERFTPRDRKSHPDVATARHNLGLVYCKQSKYKMALEQFRTALKIRTSILGENHPAVAETRHNMNMVCELQSKHDRRGSSSAADDKRRAGASISREDRAKREAAEAERLEARRRLDESERRDAERRARLAGGGGQDAQNTKAPPTHREAQAQKATEEQAEYLNAAGSLAGHIKNLLDQAEDHPLEDRKKLFKDLQRQLHPDKNPERVHEAKVAFQKLQDRRDKFLAQ